MLKVIKNSSDSQRAVIVALTWFFITFPGRAGFDTIYAIQMIRDGQTTNWWTAWYFRILQLLTIDGRVIWIFSLVGILTLTLSFLYFIKSIPLANRIKNFAFLGTILSPIFGVFGVTVQHDVFQTSGLLLLIGLEIRQSRNLDVSKKEKFTFYSTSFLLMATSHAAAIAISLAILVLVVRHRDIRLAIALSVGFLSFTLISAIGIDSSMMKYGKYDSVILDLKCIAQHPDARITDSQWKFLETMLPRKDWQKSEICSSLSDMPFMPKINYTNVGLTETFVKTYLLISIQNPSLWAQSHIVRTTLALPPPFFRSPENMVDLDYSKPVGQGTNWALQKNNNIVIHPSVDDPSLKIEIPVLHQADFFIQALSFLVNQASWFWGWAGLWLWPTMLLLFLIAYSGRQRFLALITTSYPVLSLHAFYVVFGWGPTPRHLQVTIIVGIFALLVFMRIAISSFVDKFQKFQ